MHMQHMLDTHLRVSLHMQQVGVRMLKIGVNVRCDVPRWKIKRLTIYDHAEALVQAVAPQNDAEVSIRPMTMRHLGLPCQAL